MFIYKKKALTPSLRTKTFLNYLTIFNKNFFFFYKKKRKIGIGRAFGKIVTKHKRNSASFFDKYFFYNFNFTKLSLIVGFFFLKKTLNFVTMLKTAVGTYHLVQQNYASFFGFYFLFWSPILLYMSLPYTFFKTTTFFTFLNFLQRTQTFCFLMPFKSSLIKFCKSSGCFCTLLNFLLEKNLVLILLPSLKKKFFHILSIAQFGRVSFFTKNQFVLGKAGTTYHMGFRPKVRGVAMNPVDHPHGGRTKTNKPEVSPWGWVTKFNK